MENRQRRFINKIIQKIFAGLILLWLFKFFKKPGIGITRLKMFWICVAKVVLYPVLLISVVAFIDLNYIGENYTWSFSGQTYGQIILLSMLSVVVYNLFFSKSKLWINNLSTVLLATIPLALFMLPFTIMETIDPKKPQPIKITENSEGEVSINSNTTNSNSNATKENEIKKLEYSITDRKVDYDTEGYASVRAQGVINNLTSGTWKNVKLKIVFVDGTPTKRFKHHEEEKNALTVNIGPLSANERKGFSSKWSHNGVVEKGALVDFKVVEITYES